MPAEILSFPQSREKHCPFDPPSAYARLRSEEPVSRMRIWNDQLVWFVSRYEDVRRLLSDPRVSSDVTRSGFPAQSAGTAARNADVASQNQPFIFRDEPEHSHYRRMFTGYFSAKRVNGLRPWIEKVIGKLLDEMEQAGPPVDLVQSFALPLPSLVIGHMLGVPESGLELFQSTATLLIKRDSSPQDVVDAHAELAAYLEEIVDRLTREPGDDLLSELITKRVSTGELTRQQLIDNALLLLGAGHETTANMLALGTLALLHNPVQLAIVRDTQDPQRINNAVEELLRYLTITHSGRRRTLLEDVEIAGTVMRAGDAVILANDSANRDAAVFERPDELDVDRSDVRKHLAFSHGVHQCLGQNLARIELQLAYPALVRRFPTLRTATDDIPFKEDMNVYGVHALPVTW